MSGETKSNGKRTAIVRVGKKLKTYRGNWRHKPDKKNTKLPIFIKEKNDPLRMIYKGKRYNVLRGGDFTKTFRKAVRRAIKDGEKFRLPLIKTFSNFGINSKGNIVEKKKLKKDYLHRYRFNVRFSNGRIKTLMGSFVDRTKKKNSNTLGDEIEEILEALRDQYNDAEADVVDNSIVEEVTALLEPPAPTLIMGTLIPDNKYVDTNQVWNTGEGCCFYDYLKHLYATPLSNGKWNCKVPKILRLVCLHKQRIWEELNGCYGCYDEEHISWGVSADMIERFCKKYEINCYLINNTNEFIFYYNEGNKYTPSIVGMIANGHFNPITDDWKRKSLVSRTRAIKKAKKEKEKEEGPEEENPPEMVLVPLPTSADANMLDLMVEKIKETGTTPNPYTLNFEVGHISGFRLGDVKYVYDTPDYSLAKLWAEEKKEVWDGKSLKSIGIKMFEKDDKIFKAKSRMSPDMWKLFSHKQVKDRSHRGFTCEEDNPPEVNVNTIGFDINGAYTDCVLNPLDRWFSVGFNSVWEEYKKRQDGKIGSGFYYVETPDSTLFHRNNIYSTCIVAYGLRKKIITHDDIKYYMRPLHYSKRTLFHNLFSKYLNVATNKKIGKFLCNLTTGLLGRHIRKKTNPKCSTEFSDVSNFYANHRSPFCYSQAIDEDTNLFIYGQKWEMPRIDNHIPMYIQILDNMNIKQYEMMKKFLKPNVFKNLYDYPIYRKVDMFACDKQYLKKNYKAKCSNKRGGYKMEIPKKFYNSSYKYRGLNNVVIEWNGESTRHNFVMNLFAKSLYRKQIEKLDVTDSNQWEKIEKRLFGDATYNPEKNARSIYIPSKPVVCVLGDGGTGKSYIIKKIDEGHNPLKMCFTNKASLNIGGGTFHRQLGLNKRLEMSVSKLDTIVSQHDCIIVDEISMNPAWSWNYICWLRELTKLPLLLCGDWGQVRPVEKTKKRYDKYNQHPRVHNLMGCITELTVNHRIGAGQEEYAKLLHDNKNKMENINIEEFELCDDEPVPTKNITYMNKTRKYVNQIISEMVIENKNIPEDQIFTIKPKGKSADDEEFIEEPFMIVPEESDDEEEEEEEGEKKEEEKGVGATQTIRVFANTPMIARVTEKKGETLFNNEDFIIDTINNETTILRSLNRKEDDPAYRYEIETEKLQSKFLVAWAITTHKAQGQTIKEKIRIWDWSYMNTELRYTAMSRVTRRQDVFIQPEYKK